MDELRNTPIDPLGAAKDELKRAAETCEHNAPIHEAEGNLDQAALARANAVSYRAGLEKLEA